MQVAAEHHDRHVRCVPQRVRDLQAVRHHRQPPVEQGRHHGRGRRPGHHHDGGTVVDHARRPGGRCALWRSLSAGSCGVTGGASSSAPALSTTAPPCVRRSNPLCSSSVMSRRIVEALTPSAADSWSIDALPCRRTSASTRRRRSGINMTIHRGPGRPHPSSRHSVPAAGMRRLATSVPEFISNMLVLASSCAIMHEIDRSFRRVGKHYLRQRRASSTPPHRRRLGESMPALLFGSISTLADTSEEQRAAFNEAFARHGVDWRWERDEYRQLLTSNGGAARIAEFAQAARPETSTPLPCTARSPRSSSRSCTPCHCARARAWPSRSRPPAPRAGRSAW